MSTASQLKKEKPINGYRYVVIYCDNLASSHTYVHYGQITDTGGFFGFVYNIMAGLISSPLQSKTSKNLVTGGTRHSCVEEILLGVVQGFIIYKIAAAREESLHFYIIHDKSGHMTQF